MSKKSPARPPSPFLLKWFRRYVRRFLRKNFHGLHLLGDPPDAPAGEPLIVFMNHPSWWDPMVGLFLAEQFFPGRDHYAPIDQKALERYGVLKRMGFFGIETERPRAAKQFLDAATGILAQNETALWLTPQGEFTDPRQRPVTFKPGLAHLASRLSGGIAVPLAVEYPFWKERTPELLAAFGRPLDLAVDQDSETWSGELHLSLTEAQDRLAAAAIDRDPKPFTQLLAGRSGIGGLYDRWRKVRGIDTNHASISEP